MTKGFTHESRNAQTVEWYTPPWVFKELRTEFDLDPCAPSGGLPWIPAKQSFSVAENGLIKEWKGRVWLNPPYGPETKNWLGRMHEHRSGIALVFARTDCAWYHDFCAKADAILFLKGRVNFVHSKTGLETSGAGCGSILVAWGQSNAMALDGMRDKGQVVLYRRGTWGFEDE